MQEAEFFPRYMAHQLRTNLAATVVGKLVEINEKRQTLTLQTDSEAKISVEGVLNEGQEIAGFTLGRYYQLRGVCRSGREMQVQGWTSFGSEFDLVSYNQMLNLATKEFRNLFYS